MHIEWRKGKALSKKNAKTLKAAHGLIGTLLQQADPDDLAEPLVGGPQGDKSMPSPDGQGILDASGSRQVPHLHCVFYGPVRGGRSSRPDMEVR